MPLRQLYPDLKSTTSNIVRVDIIAVHGLNPRSKDDRDHAWNTWCKPPGPKGRLWLRDDLPQYLPETRIFLFEYNSTAVYGKDRDTFIGKASELLEAIRIEREDIESRPILFLGHSMGGLLIKQALINAYSNPKYTPIKDATTGLAFFATPHHGGDQLLVSLGSIVAKIATVVGFQKGDDVLETLKKGRIFSDVMQEHWRHQLLKYDIISFWGALDKIVPAESARFGMPGNHENVVKLNADHSGVCKFGSSLEDQDNFKLVRSNIKDLYKNALRTDHPAVNSSSYILSYPLNSIMPVKTFVQRTTLLEQIREQLNRSLCEEIEGETRKVGIWGLGGAGKSQLARSYLRRYRADYNATFWIEAGQTTSIDRDFLQIYHLFTNASSSNNSLSAEDVLRAVHSWFVSRRGRWLFVFDGADQLENESDIHFVNISRYIPESPDVHIIITSRSSRAQTLSTFEGVKVGELEGPQAVELFFKCSEITTTQQKVVDEVKFIVKELGHLALAITLAGSYVSQTPRLSSNLSAYLEDYHRRRQEILSEQPNKLIHQYGESVMTVWEMSYSAVENQLPEAGRFFTLLAFLNYEDIFLDLFGLDTNAGSPLPKHLWSSVIWEQDIVSIYMIEKCFAILEKHSLLQRQENRAAYSMHKLVHAWGYNRLTKDEQLKFSRSTFELLLEAIGRSKNTPEDKLQLVPHVMANFATLASASGVSDPSIVNTLNELVRVGMFMTDIGRLPEGYLIEKYILNEKRRILGEEHPDTIRAMNNLAVTLGDQGQLGEAATMEKEVLEKRRRILGEEHPDTIRAMSNLAITLRDQGQLDEAATMEKDVLEKRRRILGEEHPDTISAMNNLAITLGNQGQLDEAAMMKKEVLEKSRRILGEEHPDTISAMNNLANTLGDQGQLDEAAMMKKEVLEKSRRILGEEHPDTISAMNNLANTLGDQGQLDEAATILKEVLEKRRRILGEEHPDTISAMNNLAITLRDQGQLDEAATMKREVLEKRRRILGEEHPDTIRAMNNFAVTLGDQGQLDEAISLLDIAVQKMKRIYGDQHPFTKMAVGNLTRYTNSRAKHYTTIPDRNPKKNKKSTLSTRLTRLFHSKAL